MNPDDELDISEDIPGADDWAEAEAIIERIRQLEELEREHYNETHEDPHHED